MSNKKKVVCRVRLKDGVLDPQGVTIRHALEQLGFGDVIDVRSGKIFELTFREGVNGNLRAQTEEICRKVLANPVIEEFEVKEE
jgi:phosphoribosylformylglycinamidine synthase PurS subunit